MVETLVDNSEGCNKYGIDFRDPMISCRSISGVDDVIAAFVWWKALEQVSCGFPCCLDGSRRGGTHEEVLELAKTYSMGLSSGLYGGKKKSLSPTPRIAPRTDWPLWEPRLSRMTISPGRSVGTRTCST
jgi:hypothetical protein